MNQFWELLGSVNSSDNKWSCLAALTIPFLMCLVMELIAVFLNMQ